MNYVTHPGRAFEDHDEAEPPEPTFADGGIVRRHTARKALWCEGCPIDRGVMPGERYRVFVGPHTLYEPGAKPLKMADITDGTSNTIFAVEAAETVPWPQPKELQYDRNGELPALGVPGRKGFNAAMMDGSVRFVRNAVPLATWRALGTRAGGEVIASDF